MRKARRLFLSFVVIWSFCYFFINVPADKHPKQEVCVCKSAITGKSYNFCYRDPQNLNSIGKKFNCSLLSTLEDLGIISDHSRLSNVTDVLRNQSNVVFASSTSDDHMHLSLKSYKSVRRFHPRHKYILYGLNMSEAFIEKLPQRDKHFEFRVFNTSQYPSFVNNWLTYNFKPLLMAQMLKEYKAVWWIDAHIELLKSNISRNLQKEIILKRNSSYFASVVSLSDTSHSNFAVLNPAVLTYFPTSSMRLLQRQRHVAAGLIFLPRTRYTMQLFKWWILCALTEECMNPPGSRLRCVFRRDRYKHPGHCFRFDQSVLNLLLLNDFQDYRRYYSKKLSESFLRMVD